MAAHQDSRPARRDRVVERSLGVQVRALERGLKALLTAEFGLLALVGDVTILPYLVRRQPGKGYLLGLAQGRESS